MLREWMHCLGKDVALYTDKSNKYMKRRSNYTGDGWIEKWSKIGQRILEDYLGFDLSPIAPSQEFQMSNTRITNSLDTICCLLIVILLSTISTISFLSFSVIIDVKPEGWNEYTQMLFDCFPMKRQKRCSDGRRMYHVSSGGSPHPI